MHDVIRLRLIRTALAIFNAEAFCKNVRVLDTEDVANKLSQVALDW